MKLVNRKEFLQMPKGTVFAKKTNVCTETSPVHVLVETLGDYSSSVDITSFWSGDESVENLNAYLYLEKHLGENIEMELFINRDGLFEDEDQYYIFSRNEVQQMIDELTQALEDGYKEESK